MELEQAVLDGFKNSLKKHSSVDDQEKNAQFRNIVDEAGSKLKNLFRRPMTDSSGKFLYDHGGPLWRAARAARGGDIPSNAMTELNTPTVSGALSRSPADAAGDSDTMKRILRDSIEGFNRGDGGGLATNPLVVGTGAGGLGLLGGYAANSSPEVEL